MAMAIQITSCLTQARDRRRYGILTTTFEAPVCAGPTLPVGWTVVGVADFNGDGKPDYLLYNGSTRQTAIWYLNNNVLSSGLFGPGLPAG